jgi:hypothetical protein
MRPCHASDLNGTRCVLDRFVGIGFVEAAYMLRRVFEQMMDHMVTRVRNSKVLFH